MVAAPAAFPEERVFGERESVGKFLVADQLVERGQSGFVARVLKIFDIRPGQDQRRIFETPDARDRRLVAVVNGPEIGDGVDRRRSGCHDVVFIGLNPKLRIASFGIIVVGHRDRTREHRFDDIQPHLPLRLGNLSARQQLASPLENPLLLGSRCDRLSHRLFRSIARACTN